MPEFVCSPVPDVIRDSVDFDLCVLCACGTVVLESNLISCLMPRSHVLAVALRMLLGFCFSVQWMPSFSGCGADSVPVHCCYVLASVYVV